MIDTLLNLLRYDGARFSGVSPWVWPLCLIIYGGFAANSGQKVRVAAQPMERKNRRIHNPQNRQIVFEAAQTVSSIKAFQEKIPV